MQWRSEIRKRVCEWNKKVKQKKEKNHEKEFNALSFGLEICSLRKLFYSLRNDRENPVEIWRSSLAPNASMAVSFTRLMSQILDTFV